MKLTPIESLTFLPAYLPEKNKRGKIYGLAGIRRKTGVYFIRENGILVYVGMSRSNLQEALYRHFQDWRKSWRQKRTTYTFEPGVHEVACITTDKDAAHPLEKCYILEYNPRDNFMRYEEYKNNVEITINELNEGINCDAEVPF
jgi:hypothetical protein